MGRRPSRGGKRHASTPRHPRCRGRSDHNDEFEFQVEGLPPAKSEAKSIFAADSSHGARVRRLLEAALAAANQANFAGFGCDPVEMDVYLRHPGSPPSDVTNYLGGIADVLEDKSHRTNLTHLGDLAGVALYDNDRQFVSVSLRRTTSETVPTP